MVTGTFSHLTNGFVRNQNINLKLAILGAPGSGKSTLSAGLLYFAKLFSFKADAVPEVAKWHIYNNVNFNDTNYEYKKFTEQKDLEYIYPKDLEILICEAPLIISAIYAAYYYGNDSKIAQDMLAKAQEHKNSYTHFFVSRKLIKFESFGRNETEEQSEQIHDKTLEVLEKLQINFTVINRYDSHIPLQILNMVGAIRKDNNDCIHKQLIETSEALNIQRDLKLSNKLFEDKIIN